MLIIPLFWNSNWILYSGSTVQEFNTTCDLHSLLPALIIIIRKLPKLWYHKMCYKVMWLTEVCNSSKLRRFPLYLSTVKCQRGSKFQIWFSNTLSLRSSFGANFRSWSILHTQPCFKKAQSAKVFKNLVIERLNCFKSIMRKWSNNIIIINV